MSPVGVSYDQNSRFSLFPDFCESQICYKWGAFIKQEMIRIDMKTSVKTLNHKNPPLKSLQQKWISKSIYMAYTGNWKILP